VTAYISQVHVSGRKQCVLGNRIFEAGVVTFGGQAVIVMVSAKAMAGDDSPFTTLPVGDFPPSIIKDIRTVFSDARRPISDKEHEEILSGQMTR
jgi:hypothetical protein